MKRVYQEVVWGSKTALRNGADFLGELRVVLGWVFYNNDDSSSAARLELRYAL